MARLALLMLGLVALAAGSLSQAETTATCAPTRPDALGPFYKPGAPLRSKVGTGGYVLSGRVMAARTCRPLVGARIELWLVNEQGDYDDAHRAALFSRRDGRYRFESNRPIAYEGRPPHIHILVRARGFRKLVTQHYPRASRNKATFNLVLGRR
jgi:protocatechuate 3,4-dioxygenase beta subunit